MPVCDDTRSQSCRLEIGFTVVLPLAFTLLFIASALLSLLPWPTSLRSFGRLLRSPFRQLLDIEELPETTAEGGGLIRTRPAPWKKRTLVVGSAGVMVCWLTATVFELARRGATLHILEAVAQLVIWAFSTSHLILASLSTAPIRLLVLWLVSAIGELMKAYLVNSFRRLDPLLIPRVVYALAVTGLIYVAGSLPIKDLLPGPQVAMPGEVPTSKASCPEDAVTLWQWSTFSFFQPLLNVAKERTLEESDVWSLSPFFKHRNIFRRFQQRRMQRPKQSLIWTLIQLNSLDLIIDLSLKLWTAVVGFVSTFAVKGILDALATRDPAQRPTAFAFACLQFLVNMSFAQADLWQKWHSRRCYERSRGQLFCLLHDKALRRKDFSSLAKASAEGEDEGKKKNKEDDEPAGVGKIVNLMNNDTFVVSDRFWSFSDVVTVPVRLLIALGFLYSIMGWSALAGLVVVALAYLLNWPLIKIDIWLTKSFFGARDKRMNVAHETIQSIRFLKYMGWENRWADKVRDLRHKELSWRIKDAVLGVALGFIWSWVPSAVLIASFWALTSVAGRSLTVSTAFVAISLFGNLQSSLQGLPNQVKAWLRAMVSVRRIEDFLNEDDVPEWVTSLTRPSPDSTPLGTVALDKATFAWPTASSEAARKAKDASPAEASNGHGSGSATPRRFSLGPCTMRLPKGKLTLVCGATGAGKTTFLTALLGELDCVSGTIAVNKTSVAYAPQHPWLEADSIRANITFQTPFEEERYAAVLDACALRPDLATLDHGDLTEIGERGVSLSGGQKMRIALARAIYSHAELVLLDDPLAAVDMHTARTLVTEGLKGPLLENRTVVLVTHHLSLCKEAASTIVHLADGRQDYFGDATAFLSFEVEEEATAAQAQPETDAGEANGQSPENDADADEKDAKENGAAGKGRRRASDVRKLIEEEKRKEGRVSIHTYMTYIRSSSYLGWSAVIVLLLLARLNELATQWTLKTWGEAYSKPRPPTATAIHFPDPTADFPPPEEDVNPWLRLYFGLGILSAMIIIAQMSVGYTMSIFASRKLFGDMLDRVVRAPSRWFDRTPVGRILNRFASDIDTVDFSLAYSLTSALRGSLAFVFSCGVIIGVVPPFAPFALVIAWLYIRLAPAYVRCARDLRRLESVNMSPLFQNFSNLLHGIQSIRAFAAEQKYIDRFFESCDVYQKMDHHYWLCSMWLMWRYDCLGSVVVFLTTAFALGAGVQEGLAAICIVQSEAFAEASRRLVQVFAQLELDFNSVERVGEYLDLPQEAPSIIPSRRPPAYWPSDVGGLEVEGLEVRYAEELPMVLKGISFAVKPGEKVGVVGRTGSGKSTLALALLRMIEPTGGRIVLDGIDITSIGLEDLRTRITIVSQDVTLFAGSIRSNLDPLGEHSEEECWDVLRRCHLASDPLLPISSPSSPSAAQKEALITDLDATISEGGTSFSAGQRQLLALARAMMRRSKVVIMDEATSAIDLETDEKIQRTIREGMQDALVITIAHRLLTVIDYDRILVLDSGRLVEYDSPRRLLETPGGRFRRFCEQSADWAKLRKMAGSSQT